MSYHVIYRTGGWANFCWKSCFPVRTREAAEALKESCERMGYPAVIHEVPRG